MEQDSRNEVIAADQVYINIFQEGNDTYYYIYHLTEIDNKKDKKRYTLIAWSPSFNYACTQRLSILKEQEVMSLSRLVNEVEDLGIPTKEQLEMLLLSFQRSISRGEFSNEQVDPFGSLIHALENLSPSSFFDGVIDVHI